MLKVVCVKTGFVEWILSKLVTAVIVCQSTGRGIRAYRSRQRAVSYELVSQNVAFFQYKALKIGFFVALNLVMLAQLIYCFLLYVVFHCILSKLLDTVALRLRDCFVKAHLRRIIIASALKSVMWNHEIYLSLLNMHYIKKWIIHLQL